MKISTKLLIVLYLLFLVIPLFYAQAVQKSSTQTESITSPKVKVVYENYAYCIVDSLTGKKIKSLENYDKVWDFKEGMACVELFMKWGFIDIQGNEIIPAKYDKVYSFSEGLAPVKIGRKWGFVDKTGKEVIPLIYDDVLGFKNGVADVVIGGKNIKIDKTGMEVNEN